jgi:maleylacetate reductase
MPAAFTHTGPARRIVFGDGALGEVGPELDRLAMRRAMLVVAGHDAARVDAARVAVGHRLAVTWTSVQQHVPRELAARAISAAGDAGVDVLVAIGGGSAIGLAKAVAVETKLPLVVVPTTYSGSEMTPIYGLTSDNNKRTARDDHALPSAVIYDPRLLAGLPPAVVGPSALNALAHCAEALWAANRGPITDALALDGANRIHRHLPDAYSSSDPAARGQVLIGAALAGMALADAGTSLHHALCHLLGGMFDAPHAETHAIMLPYVIGHLRPALSGSVERLAGAVGSTPDDLEHTIWSLARSVGTPPGLRAVGISEIEIDKAAQAAVDRNLPSPRPLDVGPLRAALHAAWTGEPPRRD